MRHFVFIFRPVNEHRKFTRAFPQLFIRKSSFDLYTLNKEDTFDV